MLTRLVPHQHDLLEHHFAEAVRWYPLAGVAVGLFSAFPLWLGMAATSPMLQGWLYVLLSLWATRALHWDGLADVADAAGSGLRGEGFRRVLKDSRIGAFGVIALVMGLVGQALLAGMACAGDMWWLLVFAPAAGRAGVSVLAACFATHPQAGLGRIVGAGARPGVACTHTVLTLLALWMCSSFYAMLVFTGGSLATMVVLGRLAAREGGLSGDFYGTAIITIETIAFLACLV